ncbi:MAG: MBL fold metallo-hydrolase [Thermoguttaceae bacterium]|nr:MBL fold metallo-hydrolase [Thermoguttaceae bacterium]
MTSDDVLFCPLISGSSGNASYIACGSTRLLIDCGGSGRQISSCLEEIGVDVATINGILITHAHRDHTCGAGILSRRYDVPIYASIGTWEEIQKRNQIGDVSVRNMKVFQSSSLQPLVLGPLEISFFPTPHDAPDPVGYRIEHGHASVAIATDIGCISATLLDHLDGASVVLLEANHDPVMLRNGPYTDQLKRRILSNVGHLSNEHAGLLAGRLLRSGTRRIYLGHLSKENNTPEMALSTVVHTLENSQVDFVEQTQIILAPRYVPGPMTRISADGELFLDLP